MNQKEEKSSEWYGKIKLAHKTNQTRGELLMNIITQEARKRQAVVKLAKRKGEKLCGTNIWSKPVEREKMEQTVRRKRLEIATGAVTSTT